METIAHDGAFQSPPTFTQRIIEPSRLLKPRLPNSGKPFPCWLTVTLMTVTVLTLGLSGTHAAPADEEHKTLPKRGFGAILWGQGEQVQGQIQFGEPVTEQGSLWTVTTTNPHFQDHTISGSYPLPIEKYFNVKTGIQCKILMETRRARMGKSMGYRWSSYKTPVHVSLAPEQLFSTPFLIFYGKKQAILNQNEVEYLREYLLNRGGFLFADEAVSVMGMESGAFLDSIKDILGRALPEYTIEPIPDDHEIYHTFYELTGPPRGHTPTGAPLEGIFINGRLAVVLSNRSYSTLWAFNLSDVEFIPEVFQFTLNVLLYAITHGNIADYSEYTGKMPSLP